MNEPPHRAILVVGEALVDAHPGAETLELHPGGGPFNTAIALARLGVPVCFVGAISRDRLGDVLEARLRAAGVDLRGASRVDAPTPMAIVADAAGEPSYAFRLAGTAHELLDPRTSGDLVHTASALHVGTLALATDPPGAAVETFAAEEASRLPLVVDPNVRPVAIADRVAYLRRFERLAALADLVKLSMADLSWLYPGAGSRAAAERLLGIGAGCVVVTEGADGATGWTGTVSATTAAPRIDVVDTVGAGDAFGAGLLAWLFRADRLGKGGPARLGGPELEAALAYAAAAGAAQCTRASAWGPSDDDVERLLDGRGSQTDEAREEEEACQSSSSTG